MMPVHGDSRRSSMLRESEYDSPAKCRERRRRRIEMRRLSVTTTPPATAATTTTASTATTTTPTPTKEHSDNQNFDRADNLEKIKSVEKTTMAAPADSKTLLPVESSSSAVIPDDIAPVNGTTSIAGRSRDMEDAISVHTNLCRPGINMSRPVHFFGVFDGHGGRHVAALCRERMHVLMEQELMSATSGQGGEEPAAVHEGWRAAMRRCFARMDEVALSFCLCGIPGPGCRCHPMDVALVGSTAVVALLAPDYIFVANCGDSRAVLCRAGTAVPLSFDQKPDREDERARIIASGGQILYSGRARVEGILAMSRAIGDKFLKSSVISEPEISITKREPEDECLILASDGLWDVLSSELACEIAHQCLQASARGVEAEVGALFPTPSASAAALLTRLAMGRKSSDNISVIIVDLK